VKTKVVESAETKADKTCIQAGSGTANTTKGLKLHRAYTAQQLRAVLHNNKSEGSTQQVTEGAHRHGQLKVAPLRAHGEDTTPTLVKPPKP